MMTPEGMCHYPRRLLLESWQEMGPGETQLMYLCGTAAGDKNKTN